MFLYQLDLISCLHHFCLTTLPSKPAKRYSAILIAFLNRPVNGFIVIFSLRVNGGREFCSNQCCYFLKRFAMLRHHNCLAWKRILRCMDIKSWHSKLFLMNL